MCPVCDTKLDSQHSFTVHIRQHNPTDHSHTCSICGKTLSSASSLDRHMLIHSGERPFKCRICNMAFTTNGNMHRHMRTHGNGNESNDVHDGNNNKCKSKKRKTIDPQTTTKESKTIQIQHSSNKIPRHSDDDTGSRTNTPTNGYKDEQQQQQQQKQQQSHLCQVCNSSFASKADLHSHMDKHPSDPIKCHDCGIILANYALFTQHPCIVKFYNGITKFGLAPQPPPPGFYDLNFADFTASKFSLIAKSFCEHNLRKPSSVYHDFECSKCQRAFPCGSALSLHQSIHNGDTYCGLCRSDFGTSALLLAHQIKHRNDAPIPLALSQNGDNTNRSAFKETPDKEGFLAMLNLQNKNSIPSDEEKLNRNEHVFENPSYYVNAKRGPKIIAPTAPNIQTRINGLSDTEFSKHDLADIQSIISVTSSATPLISNIRSSPTAASPASPVQPCNTAKPDSPVPADSPTTTSSPHTPIPCTKSPNIEKKNEDEDNKTKFSEDNLIDESQEAQKDNDNNNGSPLATLKCNLCNLVFKSANALKRHNRGHVQGGHPYACHLCLYTSLDKSTLIRHLRTHNGERPFQCKICKYAFTTKANCERHVKKRHKKANTQEIRTIMQFNSNLLAASPSELTKQNVEKHEDFSSLITSDNETICRNCNVDFKVNKLLRHHLFLDGCIRKPYTCTLCKLGFTAKSICIKHISKQHPNTKEDIMSMIIVNGSSIASNSCSELSESEACNRDSPGMLMPSFDGESMDQHSDSYYNDYSNHVAQQSSLSALCQIVGNVQASVKEPMNLTGGSEYDGDDSTEDLPLDLAKTASIRDKNSDDFEQPLDLAVHALDLSVKPKSPKDLFPDIPKATEALRTAASSLLALQTVVPPFMPAPANLFRPSISQTPPVSAHTHLFHTPPQQSLVNRNINDLYHLSSLQMQKNSFLSKNQRCFTCVYCAAGFTLKSNMERHIKRKHPEYARPSRSRGSLSYQIKEPIPSTMSLLSKPNNLTLSNKTRAALRVVLSNKVMSSSRNQTNENSISRPTSPCGSVSSNFDDNMNGDDGDTTDENAGDLASVSSLIDHSASSSNALKQYFDRAKEDSMQSPNNSEAIEEVEDLSKSKELIRPEVIIKEAKTINNTNTDSKVPVAVTKKRSAYTDSPNSVSCPYCSRKFPWTSSLRRHILTHTGLKPYKCPKCPILFTTKSNCERHLVRKHGRDKQKSAIDILNVPQDTTKQHKCNVCPNSSFTTQGNLRKHFYLRHWTKTGKGPSLLKMRRDDGDRHHVSHNTNIPSETNGITKSYQLTFKCHICNNQSFDERLKCLAHLQSCHSNEYETLLCKGAVDKVPTSETKMSLSFKSTEERQTDHSSKVRILHNLFKIHYSIPIRFIAYFAHDISCPMTI